MKRRFFIKLNLILAVVFFVFLLIFLLFIDPFQINIFVFILFYLIVFGLILSLLNLIKIPFWIRILISIAIIFILLVKSF